MRFTLLIESSVRHGDVVVDVYSINNLLIL